jgi:hypothetical protein
MKVLKNTAVIRHFATPRPVAPPTEWFLGLDFGQRQDFSALATLELKWHSVGRCPVHYTYGFQPELTIRELRRFPLDTHYTALGPGILDYIRHTFGDVQPVDLVLDASGPGAPMVEIFRNSLSKNVSLHPVIITAGQSENNLKGGVRSVPRNALLTRLLLTMAAGSLIAPPELKLWNEFVEEMLELSANDGHPSAGAHDDLVIGSCLGLHRALASAPELLPAIRDDDDSQTAATRFGWKDKPIF